MLKFSTVSVDWRAGRSWTDGHDRQIPSSKLGVVWQRLNYGAVPQTPVSLYIFPGKRNKGMASSLPCLSPISVSGRKRESYAVNYVQPLDAPTLLPASPFKEFSALSALHHLLSFLGFEYNKNLVVGGCPCSCSRSTAEPPLNSPVFLLPLPQNENPIYSFA